MMIFYDMNFDFIFQSDIFLNIFLIGFIHIFRLSNRKLDFLPPRSSYKIDIY